MSLAGICTALAAVSVTAAGKTPLTYEPNGAARKLKNSFSTAELPARIIMPFGADVLATAKALTIAGAPKQTTWQLADLLLWDTIGQTRGIADIVPDLLAYVDAYNTAIRAALRITSSPVAIIESWTFSPGVLTWNDVKPNYYGVEVKLTIKETG